MDAERHKAHEDSGLQSLLARPGILFHDARTPKNEGGSTKLSASNVEQSHLKLYYRWEFYGEIQRLRDLNEEAGPSLEDVWAYISLAKRTNFRRALKLPDDWKNPSEDDVAFSTKTSLAVHLGVGADSATANMWKEWIEFRPRKSIETLPDSEPKVISHEAGSNPGNPALCIEWTMLKILGFPGLRVDEYNSELEVERHIGSFFPGFFKIENCITSSGTEVRFPTAIGCFGSFPMPDFASRLDASILQSGNGLPPSFRPVVLLGEGKRIINIIQDDGLPSNSPEQHRVTAQLAWAAQPTLSI
ncbi:hypothetical protein K439DRAFT_1622623 [Ramaria rubella]|nr:hypothetical protein K439DRAFT_1622623 [Ramaria rubella]